MVKPIVHDPFFLALKSEPAAKGDAAIANDLLETLIANKDHCVGMAANMIGIRKRIIAFDNNGTYMTMFNPEIIKASLPYNTQEGCLSLLGGPRPCTRFQLIQVRWLDADFRFHTQSFSGWTAQIIQHEVDHCNGILI